MEQKLQISETKLSHENVKITQETVRTVESTDEIISKHKTIKDCEETNFGGTLFLSKEHYKKGMALSCKMKNMNSW